MSNTVQLKKNVYCNGTGIGKFGKKNLTHYPKTQRCSGQQYII